MFEDIQEDPMGMRKRIQFIYRELDKRISGAKDKGQIKLLDIGCGTGEFVTIPLGNLGVRILGIDTHLPSIEFARKRNTFKNVTFKCTQVDTLSRQRFDGIICSEVLEHLEDPAEMLKSIGKMLKEDGICIITIPNGYGPKETEIRLYRWLCRLLESLKVTTYVKFLIKFLSSTVNTALGNKRQTGDSNLRDTLNEEAPHIQFYTFKHFKRLTDEHGLSILKMENRRFLSGPFSDIILSRSSTLCNWNVKVASWLPHFLVSSWMFVVKRDDQGKEPLKNTIY